MTILTLNKKELENKIGKITEETENNITMMGTPVEETTDSEISIEVFPNRPDLLSMQGLSRSYLQYIGKKSIQNYKIHKPEKNYKVKIEKSVKKVRPHTVCAIIKGLKLNDEKIKQIVDIQEKLHLTIGRKRKKVAIGIYPMEKIKLPIKFLAKKPNEIKFQPLESMRAMTGTQILRSHPTGRDYAHLLETADVYPIFVDADDKVLSMPPIINSQETGKVTEKTKDVFIECSGFNLEYLKKTLNILVTAFADMGGKIYAMEIKDDKTFLSPDLSFEKLDFKIKDINKNLGMEFSEKEIKKLLEKMGLGFEKDKKQKTYALIPPYRTDILHWIDLTEEIALAYGYENFKPVIPKISTIGKEEKSAINKKTIGQILSGLGLLEISSYHLSVKKDVKKMHYDFKDFIELEDSKTEYNILRFDLISNLLKILSENTSSTYPQKIFETGTVFSKNPEKETGIEEKQKLAISIIDEKVNFTDLKQILDYLFKMLNLDYEIKETESPHYITGRVGSIIVNKKEVGIIGELSPRVLKNWKLNMPVASLELGLDFLNND